MQVLINGQLYDRVLLADAAGNPINFGGFQIQEVSGVTSGGAPVVPTNDTSNRALILHSAADLAAKEITLPSNLPNGGFFFVAADHAITTLTFTAGFTVRANPGTLAPFTFVKLQRISASEFWCFM